MSEHGFSARGGGLYLKDSQIKLLTFKHISISNNSVYFHGGSNKQIIGNPKKKTKYKLLYSADIIIKEIFFFPIINV